MLVCEVTSHIVTLVLGSRVIIQFDSGIRKVYFASSNVVKDLKNPLTRWKPKSHGEVESQ